MTSSSFLFVVRVPVEEENSPNDKNKDAKKSKDTGCKDEPLKQTNIQKGSESSDVKSSEFPEIDSNDKTADLQGVTLSESSDADIEGSERVAPVKLDIQDENGTSSLPIPQPSSTEIIDISATPSDPSATPVPPPSATSDTLTSGTTDPSPIEISDPSVAEDTELESPPPWDFTPPASPSSTSAPQDSDTGQTQECDTNQAPQKDLPSAWTFPPSETLEKETPLVQKSEDKAPEDPEPVSESKLPQSQETSVDPQLTQTSPIPITDTSSNKPSDSPSEKISDSITAEKEGQDVDNNPIESADPAPKSDDDSTKKLPTENIDKPRKSVESDVEKDNKKDDEKDLEIFVKKESLFQRTLSALESFAVKNLSVHKTANGKSFQFVFVEEGENCEEILNKLAELGIGDNAQSSISMFETSIYKGAGVVMDEEEEDEEDLYNSV